MPMTSELSFYFTQLLAVARLSFFFFFFFESVAYLYLVSQPSNKKKEANGVPS